MIFKKGLSLFCFLVVISGFDNQILGASSICDNFNWIKSDWHCPDAPRWMNVLPNIIRNACRNDRNSIDYFVNEFARVNFPGNGFSIMAKYSSDRNQFPPSMVWCADCTFMANIGPYTIFIWRGKMDCQSQFFNIENGTTINLSTSVNNNLSSPHSDSDCQFEWKYSHQCNSLDARESIQKAAMNACESSSNLDTYSVNLFKHLNSKGFSITSSLKEDHWVNQVCINNQSKTGCSSAGFTVGPYKSAVRDNTATDRCDSGDLVSVQN